MNKQNRANDHLSRDEVTKAINFQKYMQTTAFVSEEDVGFIDGILGDRGENVSDQEE